VRPLGQRQQTKCTHGKRDRYAPLKECIQWGAIIELWQGLEVNGFWVLGARFGVLGTGFWTAGWSYRPAT